MLSSCWYSRLASAVAAAGDTHRARSSADGGCVDSEACGQSLIASSGQFGGAHGQGDVGGNEGWNGGLSGRLGSSVGSECDSFSVAARRFAAAMIATATSRSSTSAAMRDRRRRCLQLLRSLRGRISFSCSKVAATGCASASTSEVSTPGGTHSAKPSTSVGRSAILGGRSAFVHTVGLELFIADNCNCGWER